MPIAAVLAHSGWEQLGGTAGGGGGGRSRRQSIRLREPGRKILYSGILKRRATTDEIKVVLLDHLLFMARPAKPKSLDQELFEIVGEVSPAGAAPVRTAPSATRAGQAHSSGGALAAVTADGTGHSPSCTIRWKP